MYEMWAAEIVLRRTQWTIREWMKECGVKGVLLDTDRRRTYIHDLDVFTLLVYKNVNVRSRSEKYRKQLLRKYELKVDKIEAKIGATNEEEKRLYSIAEVASLLGVSVGIVRQWIAKYKVEKIMIRSDKERVYIRHSDVLMLAGRYESGVPCVYPVDVVADFQEIREQMRVLAAEVEELRRDFEGYVKRSFYLG